MRCRRSAVPTSQVLSSFLRILRTLAGRPLASGGGLDAAAAPGGCGGARRGALAACAPFGASAAAPRAAAAALRLRLGLAALAALRAAARRAAWLSELLLLELLLVSGLGERAFLRLLLLLPMAVRRCCVYQYC
jgi:hypothetical protein